MSLSDEKLDYLGARYDKLRERNPGIECTFEAFVQINEDVPQYDEDGRPAVISYVRLERIQYPNYAQEQAKYRDRIKKIKGRVVELV